VRALPLSVFLIDPAHQPEFDVAAMRNILLLLCCAALSGCAGGPTHDYYNPAVANPPKFKGDVTIELVDDLEAAQKKCVAEGYLVIGTSVYTGDRPKASELKAQARRVHATHVVYAMQEAGFGNMQMHAGFLGGSIGSAYSVGIVFLGK
jgi:hypothetical protein